MEEAGLWQVQGLISGQQLAMLPLCPSPLRQLIITETEVLHHREARASCWSQCRPTRGQLGSALSVQVRAVILLQ